MQQVKSLVSHGNSKVLVIDKALLKAASLDEKKVVFKFTVKPNGGLLIESVDLEDKDLKDQAFKNVLQNNYELLKRLTNR